MYMPRRSSYRHRTWMLHPLFILWMLFCIGLAVYSIASSKQWAADELARDGYTSVEMTGWQAFARPCQKSTAQGFTGIQNGQRRSGVVCTSLFYSYVVAD